MKRSSESQPEFFVDRCLGKSAPRRLIEAGWKIHLVADLFPDDGQFVSDPEWVEHGLSQGWTLLTQDKRIRTQPLLLSAVRAADLTIHCLSSAELLTTDRVKRFEQHREEIWRYAVSGAAGFYVVYEDRVVRRWP
ncbi:PIN-like domain-containing protein [Micromonospora sp. NPDC003197]